MRQIGFSTGALALGDFRAALRMLAGKNCSAVELSALRQEELAPLVVQLDDLDLSNFEYVSFHAPSAIDPAFETEAASSSRSHIEPGSSRGALVELDARKVMDGILRLSNQRENAVEPPLSVKRNFKGSARSKAEGADACNIGKQQIFKSGIVRDVEKNRCAPIARLCGGSRLFFQFSRCHCGSGPPISWAQYFESRRPLS